MSIRQYRPRNNRRRGISANQSMGLYFLFALAIGLQISYPLVSGDTLRYVTIFFVIAGALLMLVHALLSYGFKYFAIFGSVTFIFSLLVEILGSKTGWPFGTYAYSDSLGFKVAGAISCEKTNGIPSFPGAFDQIPIDLCGIELSNPK